MRILQKEIYRYIFILGLISVLYVDCCKPKVECTKPIDGGDSYTCNYDVNLAQNAWAWQTGIHAPWWKYGYVKGRCHPRGFPCSPGVCKKFRYESAKQHFFIK